MKVQTRFFCMIVFWASNVIVLWAQTKNSDQQKYINTYSTIAVKQMNKHKVPASITLAQGILESASGKSTLAVESKNHFGIKADASWQNKKKLYQTKEILKDNKQGHRFPKVISITKLSNGKYEYVVKDWFRVYNNVEESFEDHSLFLKKPRYAPLFELKMTDYKAWAIGLQECGYATSQNYANSLINLIERYELYRYDRKGGSVSPGTLKKMRSLYEQYGLTFVIAEENDNLEQIAYDTGISVKKLRKYNEIPEDFPIEKGSRIYMEKKKAKAAKPNYEHVVKIGDSMHSIAQQYGIRVKNLYRLNAQTYNYVPVEDDVLRLR